jgi:hypothetical protein
LLANGTALGDCRRWPLPNFGHAAGLSGILLRAPVWTLPDDWCGEQPFRAAEVSRLMRLFEED